MSTSNAWAPSRGAADDVGRVDEADELELAGPSARLGAFFVDGIVGFVMVWLPALIVLLATGGVDAFDPEVFTLDIDVYGVAALLCFTGLVSWCWVTALLVARSGQTIGKRLLDIKVVRSDGSHATLERIFWRRNVVNWLLGVIPLYGLVDLLFIFGARQQCIHDLVADTIVVKA
ncbi:MAG TPA: RDD family protein [Gammaproteobacteria bacterium]|nr:RDD family protein [Gammaproteobacteria bacterium]